MNVDPTPIIQGVAAGALYVDGAVTVSGTTYTMTPRTYDMLVPPCSTVSEPPPGSRVFALTVSGRFAVDVTGGILTLGEP